MKHTSRKPAKRVSRNSRSYAVKHFIVALNEDGSVSKDAWLSKWGKPSVGKLAALVADASGPRIIEAVVVKQGDVDAQVARYLSRVSKNGYGRSYSGDPRWMTARYDGTDDQGNRVRKGDEVLYWPSTKKMMTGQRAKDAWLRFLSEKGDEEGMPFARNGRKRSRR